MSKKRKKIKWKNLPGTVRTCLVGTIGFFAIGMILVIYGLMFSGVSAGDIKTVTGEIISVDKVDSNLPADREEFLRKKGFDEDYIKHELKVVYRYSIDGVEGTYESRHKMDEQDSLAIGTTEELRYADVNGKIVFNPDTDSTYVVFGIVFMILGVISGIVAFVLKPKR
jgi:hypothetical protein